MSGTRNQAADLEIGAYNQVSGKTPLYFFPVGDTQEVDFLIETRKSRSGSPPSVGCIEVKLSTKWDRTWEKPMRLLAGNPKLKVEGCFGVYTGTQAYELPGLAVHPLRDFPWLLHLGKVFRPEARRAHLAATPALLAVPAVFSYLCPLKTD